MRRPTFRLVLGVLISGGILIAIAAYRGEATSAIFGQAAHSQGGAPALERGDRSTGQGPVTDKSAQPEAAQRVAANAGTGRCGTPSIMFQEQTAGTLPPDLKPGARAYDQLKTAIDRAWATACDKGLIPAGGLKEQGKPLNAFKIFNNPDANVTAIYTEDGYAILETPMFGGASGQLFVPEQEEIEEALYCFKNGAPEGDNPEGRCLVD